jgi:hypothetical protein
VDMNYNQALFLMGMVYAPSLSLVFFLLNWMEMFVLYLCFYHFCILAKKPFEPKNKNSTYMYLFFTCGASLFTFAMFLYQSPSQVNSAKNFCGPWAYDKVRYHCVSDWFSFEMPGFISAAFEYILNPMVVYVIVIVIATLYTFANASLISVREICVETSWQLKMLDKMRIKFQKMTKRGRQLRMSSLSTSAADTETRLHSLEQDRDRYRKERERYRERCKAMTEKNATLNQQLQAAKDSHTYEKLLLSGAGVPSPPSPDTGAGGGRPV